MPYIPDEDRHAFHVTGGIGWINDPNGFSCYKGDYHLFFQYHPYDVRWGPMYWGHVKTSDFIRWERLPVAIAPDTETDRDGCFSGGAVELPDGRQLLMYTGVYHKRRENGVNDEYQHQCVAVGDGINYEKYEGTPVITAVDLPEGSSALDFRDPKIWAEDGKFYAVVGNRPADGSGSVLLFESEDAFHWHFVTVLDECQNEFGRMWECPDFFPLDGGHMSEVLLKDLKKVYDNKVTAVHDVNLSIAAEVRGVEFELDEFQQKALASNNQQPCDIIVGIRPQHITVGEGELEALIEVNEMLGSEVNLHARSNEDEVVMVIPTVDLTVDVSMGATVKFNTQPRLMQLFDKATGNNLVWFDEESFKANAPVAKSYNF